MTFTASMAIRREEPVNEDDQFFLKLANDTVLVFGTTSKHAKYWKGRTGLSIDCWSADIKTAAESLMKTATDTGTLSVSASIREHVTIELLTRPQVGEECVKLRLHITGSTPSCDITILQAVVDVGGVEPCGTCGNRLRVAGTMLACTNCGNAVDPASPSR